MENDAVLCLILWMSHLNRFCQRLYLVVNLIVMPSAVVVLNENQRFSRSDEIGRLDIFRLCEPCEWMNG